MELTLEEQTLIVTFRSLDEPGRNELLRHASHQQKLQAETSVRGPLLPSGQCTLERGEERPEIVAEPIFTE